MVRAQRPWRDIWRSDIEGQTRRFPVGDGQVCRIGRAVRNTIVLDSSQVSRDHALVDSPDGRDCVFTDLGSVNGTYINGARVTGQQALKDGDVISIGEFRFNFRQTAQENAEAQDELSKTTVRLVNEEITVMVVDIRGYTPLSLKIGADKLGEVLGHFFRESGALLRAQGAWGQKYIGDAVMAIWMHDAGQPGSQLVRKALRSVYGIYEIADSLSAQFTARRPDPRRRRDQYGLRIARESGQRGGGGSHGPRRYSEQGFPVGVRHEGRRLRRPGRALHAGAFGEGTGERAVSDEAGVAERLCFA